MNSPHALPVPGTGPEPDRRGGDPIWCHKLRNHPAHDHLATGVVTWCHGGPKTAGEWREAARRHADLSLRWSYAALLLALIAVVLNLMNLLRLALR